MLQAARYATPIALGATLLFLVEPLAGKLLLPSFGGSGSVWSACLLFFQALLFAGYLYAHLSSQHLSPRAQRRLHLALLALSALWLPLRARGLDPLELDGSPTRGVLISLATTVSAPVFMLSATSPLLQRWFSEASARDPYFLYSLSNLGSIVGLLGYPLLAEPNLDLSVQSRLWSVAYLAFVVSSAVCMLDPASARAERARRASSPWPAPRGLRPVIALLAASPSALLVASSHHITQDVAPIPILWVLPLVAYLATFVIVFGRAPPRSRLWPALLLATTSTAVLVELLMGIQLGPAVRCTIQLINLFAAGIVCHGEIAKLKPGGEHLTHYYLLISLGGVLGTALATFLAPALFRDYWELHIAVVACCAAPMLARYREEQLHAPESVQTGAWGVRLAFLLALTIGLRYQSVIDADDARYRNFYGVLRVMERDEGDPTKHRLELTNGNILHGAQYLAPARRREPTTYYDAESGLALAIQAMREVRRAEGKSTELSMGVVGLGVGTVAAWGRPGDHLRFYELNPNVVSVARDRFSFLADSQATSDVELGDARVSLAREVAAGAAPLDILMIDAFTGDAVPVHLLTREAFETYLARTRPSAILAVNVSNRLVDLARVVLGAAESLGVSAMVTSAPTDDRLGRVGSRWALIFRGAAEAEGARLGARATPTRGSVLWTDDYSSVVGLFSPNGLAP